MALAVYKGIVRGRMVILEESAALPEGAEVQVLSTLPERESAVRRSLADYFAAEIPPLVLEEREADMPKPLSIPALAEAQRQFLATLEEPLVDVEYVE